MPKQNEANAIYTDTDTDTDTVTDTVSLSDESERETIRYCGLQRERPCGPPRPRAMG